MYKNDLGRNKRAQCTLGSEREQVNILTSVNLEVSGF